MLAFCLQKCAYLLIQHADVGLGTGGKNIFGIKKKKKNEYKVTSSCPCVE